MHIHEGIGIVFVLINPYSKDVDDSVSPASAVHHYLVRTGRMGALAVPQVYLQVWDIDPLLMKNSQG